MKFLTMLSVLMFSTVASAASPENIEEFVLTKAYVNGKESQGVVGVLQIDDSDKEIRLEIFDDPCGKYNSSAFDTAKCLAMPILRHMIEVPLKDQNSSCGSSLYAGNEDLSLSDGVRYELSVLDHRLRTCRDLVPSRLVIKARTYQIGTGETVTYTFMQ